MEPAIEKIPFKRKRNGTTQEFMIKKKDYGTVVFFDIFFGDLFLFSLAEDGTILVANWEAAQDEPIYLNKEDVEEMLSYALSFQKNTEDTL